MGSRNGTGRDADFPIRPGTVCKGLKTQASQIPKRCGTSWEAVGIVFSTDSYDRSRRSRTPVYARRNGNGNSPTPLPDPSSVACEVQCCAVGKWYNVTCGNRCGHCRYAI